MSHRLIEITIRQNPLVFTSACGKFGIPLAKSKSKGYLIKATVIGEKATFKYLLGPFNNANVDKYASLIRYMDENNHQ